MSGDSSLWHTLQLQHTATHCSTESVVGVERLKSLMPHIQVSFAKEPYERDNILQKRPIIDPTAERLKSLMSHINIIDM